MPRDHERAVKGLLRAAGVFVAGASSFINTYTPQAILPSLAADLGVDGAQIGLTITATLMAVALMAPVAGGISDRLGRKRLIVGAMLTLILPTLLVAASPNLPILLAGRFLQGLLLPFIFAVTIAYVGDEYSGADAIRMSGVYASGSIFGGFFGRLLAGVVSDQAGWRVAFLAIAGLTLLGAWFVSWALPREQRFRPVTGGFGATLRAYGGHLRNPRLLATCGVGFGMLFTQVATFTFINLHLTRPPFALSSSQLGSIFTIYLLGMVTTPLTTRVAVQVGRRGTALAAMLCSGCGVLLTLSSSLWGIIPGLALLCGGLFAIQALAIGYIGVTARRARSSAVGVYVTLFYVGGAVGGVAPGWLWVHEGWPGVVALLLAMVIAMAATAVLAWRETG